jgi:hypothetical protein
MDLKVSVNALSFNVSFDNFDSRLASKISMPAHHFLVAAKILTVTQHGKVGEHSRLRLFLS